MRIVASSVPTLLQTWTGTPFASGFVSVPSKPSNVSDFGYSAPSMLSNERFSSMSTAMWSIPANWLI